MVHQFDEFSKSLAEALPRRETLRRFGAGLAAVFLSPLGLEAARKVAATDPCKTFCGKCKTTKQKNQCINACNACGKQPARLVGSCGGYVCCPTGFAQCGNYCADLAGDFYNCGACGNECPPPGPNESGACIDGRCEYWCVEGAVVCNGFCSLLDQDPNNCGACGFVCGNGEYCAAGVCQSIPVCPSGGYCGDGRCICGEGEYCEPFSQRCAISEPTPF